MLIRILHSFQRKSVNGLLLLRKSNGFIHDKKWEIVPLLEKEEVVAVGVPSMSQKEQIFRV